MSEMWSAYQLERYGRMSLVEHRDGKDVGILIYKMHNEDESCFVETMFVLEEYRDKGIGRILEKRLIEKEKPRFMICDVDTSANGYKETLSKFFHAGFEELTVNGDRIVLWRYLGD